MALLDGREEAPILPGVGPRRRAFDRKVGAEKVHQVTLLGQVDAYHRHTARRAERLNEARLANPGAALEQNRLAQLHRPQGAEGVGSTRWRAPGEGEG